MALLSVGLVAFIIAIPTQARTVEGTLGDYGDDYVVVDGARFIVDGETHVRPLPGQDPEELGLEPIMLPPEDGGELWFPYSAKLFEDVGGARVHSTGRRAEEIVLLPYGEGEGD